MNTKSLLALSSIALASISAQANMIQNGSFETPTLADGTWQIYYNNEVINWTPSTYGIEVRNNVAGVAQDGINFVELDATQNSWMTQAVSISTAGSYLLSFWYNARPNVSHVSDEISWAFGGQTGVVSPSDTSPLGTWHQFSQTFALSAGQQTLRFDAIGTSDSYGGSLDNVSLTPVPEPESFAMMIAGLGLMGAIARRRAKRKA
jgi:hypothetical protein